MAIITITKKIPAASKYSKLHNIPHGSTFYKKNEPLRLLMKVKPVNFLLNSTLVNEAINRRDCLVISVYSGTLYITDGDSEVIEKDISIEVLDTVKEVV